MQRFIVFLWVLPLPTLALAQPASHVFAQSPAYQECTALATSNPVAAEAKAAEWLKLDDGVGAHHCRAMALYGQRRFQETAEALSMVRGKLPAQEVAMRSYVARQTSKAWIEAKRPDAAVAALATQINDMGQVRDNNAEISRLTAELLLERAKLRVTYGQLPQAVQDLDQAVSLAPTHEDILLERARAFAQLNDRALAEQDLAAVLKLNPANAKALEFQSSLRTMAPSN